MKMNRWSSLRTKIIAWSFVPTVIILSAVAWFTFFSYQKVLGDLALEQDGTIVQTKVYQASQALSGMLNAHLRQIVLAVDTHPELPIGTRIQNIYAQAQSLEDFDGGIYFVDSDGIVFETHPNRPNLLGADWSDTPQFRYIQTNPPGSSPITDVQDLGRGVGSAICAILAMQNTQKELIGAGYYCYKIDPTGINGFYQAFNNVSLGENIFLLDGNQRIIFSPDPTKIGKDLSQAADIQQLLQGQETSIRFRQGGEDKVVSYSRFNPVDDGSLRWILVSEQSWAEIMQPSQPYRQFLYLLLALGVIVPVLVTLYGVQHITEPIQKLIRATQQVTAGQFEHRIEVKTGDEIETLADQFNTMSAELEVSYSSLEKKVADRTRELAILNAIISDAVHSLNVQEILEAALKDTVEQMGFDAGAAFRFQANNAAILLISQQGLDSAKVQDYVKEYAAVQPAPVTPQEVTPLAIEDVPMDTIREDLLRLGFRQLIYVPLSMMERPLGFLILGKNEAAKPTPEETALLSSIGKQIGVAMQNALLYEQAGQTAILSERSRLARELHDAVTQTLFSASLIADVTPSIWKRSPEEGMHHLEELRQLTRGALAEMRTLLMEMRPESLDRADLKSLLTQLSDAFVGRVRIPVDLQIQECSALNQEVKTVFYRVAQEALNNIAKHSGARHVSLHLSCQPGELHLCISDDGLGFDLGTIPPWHMGVAIMRERAGSIGASLRMESQVGQGTTVRLDWEA